MKKKTIEKDKKETAENSINEEKNIKIPKEISQEILKKIFINLIKTIGLMIYFIILNLAYVRIEQERLVNDLNVFAGAFLITGMVMLEIAYKKDDSKHVMSAIELLVISFHTLSIMHMTTLLKYDFRIYLLTSSYIFSIYYVLKSIIIYTKGRREYLNTLSDISEIVKKEEPLKKEAKKRNIEEDNDESNELEIKTNKDKENDKKIKKEKMNKKKTETKGKVKKETSNNKPKSKRGRPKKEVKEND